MNNPYYLPEEDEIGLDDPGFRNSIQRLNAEDLVSRRPRSTYDNRSIKTDSISRRAIPKRSSLRLADVGELERPYAAIESPFRRTFGSQRSISRPIERTPSRSRISVSERPLSGGEAQALISSIDISAPSAPVMDSGYEEDIRNVQHGVTDSTSETSSTLKAKRNKIDESISPLTEDDSPAVLS